MLVACRLAGLSALGAHYAGVKLQAMRAEHGTTHQDHAGTSRAALDIEHRNGWGWVRTVALPCGSTSNIEHRHSQRGRDDRQGPQGLPAQGVVKVLWGV